MENDRFWSIATESGLSDHVRFTPGSDRTADIAGGSVRVNKAATPVPAKFAGDEMMG